MSAILRKFVQEGSCKRPVATLAKWSRTYATPPTTYQAGIKEIQQVFNDAASQSSLPGPIKGNGPFNLVSENSFVSPDRFTVDAFARRRIYPRPYRVGPDAKTSRAQDPFYQLSIDPLDECCNATLLSNFVTDMGKIKSRAVTGLTWRSQRRLTKAIKRAKMMGVMPWLSRASTRVY
ncbi:hypothetical protein OE88DRAFT_1731530 [Heliocybe sulcata]|uniref:Small ribosomal subunit protein bS18m n=1 Tax=Heliocybe sulcata TaxID=5364 RepID=A0A5C3NG87_9AGAM|nr:hypothetical protein OE88DRAFT_1731530 [Heliocybe sulcata]